MKKIVFGLLGVMLAAFVVVLFVNAKNSPQEVKKATTEMSKECGKCPSSAACTKMAGEKTAEITKCDPAKCKEMGCDPAKCKEAKCDPATCKTKMASTDGGMKKCDPAACMGKSK